jgi:phytoene synthase
VLDPKLAPEAKLAFSGMTVPVTLPQSYDLCRAITQKYAKTFYLGTMLMAPPKRTAIWAIYAWCRRTDELVDGLQSALTTPQTLIQWETQLEKTFAGHPTEPPDVALADTARRFPLDIQPFRDMIAGMQMDLSRDRYRTFEELHLYCYRVAGTVGLMSAAVMGLDAADPDTVAAATEAAIALGIAMQLTNILRDIGEDARRGRIYLPLDEMQSFNYNEGDLLAGVMDDRWVKLMAYQIQRAREFYAKAEQGIAALCRDAKWPVWTSLMLYRGILNAIEQNGYQVFENRAYVSTPKKLLVLPWAWLRSQVI